MKADADFVALVAAMRTAQRAYFRCEPGAERQQLLIASKEAERAVDIAIIRLQRQDQTPALFEEETGGYLG